MAPSLASNPTIGEFSSSRFSSPSRQPLVPGQWALRADSGLYNDASTAQALLDGLCGYLIRTRSIAAASTDVVVIVSFTSANLGYSTT